MSMEVRCRRRADLDEAHAELPLSADSGPLRDGVWASAVNPLQTFELGFAAGCSCPIVLKNSKIGPDEKARQIESQRHIAVRHYLSPAADLARFGNAKSAGPPANLLNAVSVGLP